MDVLVIGTGGREHALVRALAADPGVDAVHAAPGNPGMAAVATLHDVDPMDGPAVARLATELGVGLVVIGPEAPLVAGVADAVRAVDIACFGPTAEAARLEGSKAFAKDVMTAAGVPTAEARVCTTPDEAAAALDAFGPPYVVKDDGLAAGKGVVVTDDRQLAAEPREGLRARRHRGVPRRTRGEPLRPHATARRSTRSSRRRTSSASTTATKGPTPAAWAPTRR